VEESDVAKKTQTLRMPSIPEEWTAVADAENVIWLRQGQQSRWKTLTEPHEIVRDSVLIYEYGPLTRVEDPRAPALADASSAGLALRTVLNVLDQWIAGARENHEALGHRGEGLGGECWQSHHSNDIRQMVNDAARDLGLDEPWKRD
jgi:hypothetical protein